MPHDSQTVSPTAEAVQAQLEKILASKGFARSERMQRFLRFSVEHWLLKDPDAVKEYGVALAVYDKPQDFDPRIDPIVRVEASRLRAKLNEYYADEGREDPIVFSIRKGSYCAVVRRRRRSATAQATHSPPLSKSRNPEAEHLYLMGRHYWNKRSPAAIGQAVECFERAISLDPEFPSALTGLADCHAAQAWFEMGPPEPHWQAAEASIAVALKGNSTMAEAICNQAFRRAAFDWDWVESERLFRTAVSSKTQYATAHHWYGFFCLAPQRRLSAAMEELMRACVIDPLSPAIGTHLGCVLYYRRRHEQAIEQLLRAVELDPTFYLAYWQLAYVHAYLSQLDEAAKALEQAQALGCSEQASRWFRAYLQAKAGRTGEAQDALRELTPHTAYVSPVALALVYSALGDFDAAFESLDAAVAEHSCRLLHIKVDPAYDALKTNPRFIEVMTRLHLV